MDLSQRLDEMELAIHKPSFRKGTGRANEVNYWVFDYPPEKELEVRERVEYLKNKNDRCKSVLQYGAQNRRFGRLMGLRCL